MFDSVNQQTYKMTEKEKNKQYLNQSSKQLGN